MEEKLTSGLTLFLLTRASFQFLDALVGALQRLVLHQCGLHQRIDRVGRTRQALRDRVLSLRVARRVLELGKALEQFVDQLTLLGIHSCLLREDMRHVGNGQACSKRASDN